jgi:nickel-dependent lactate racemase
VPSLGQIWGALLPRARFETVRPVLPPAAGEPVSIMRAALETAGVVAFVRDAGASGKPLTLIVNDGHRFTATRPFLDALFATTARGVLPSAHPRLRLLVAAGTHRSAASERHEHEERVLGPWRGRFAEIAWHDAGDANAVAVEGYGFHPWLAEAGYYLACGSVEPHYFAGVTGAHKTLTVGVMSRASVEANHAHAMEKEANGLRLDGNPVHEGVVRALAALERSGARLFALNQVIVAANVVAVAAGAPLEALEPLLATVRSSFGHEVSRPADLVVASVEPPLDRDLYQADKGIKNTETGVRDGGVLVVEAACSHGVGLDHFVELLRQAPTHAAAVEVVGRRGYRLGDHKAVRLRALSDTRGVRIGLVSRGIEPGLGAVLGVSVWESRERAAAWAQGLLAGSVHGLAVEDAGNMTLRAR